MELSHIPISTFSLTVAIVSIVLQMGCNNDQEERIDELIDKILVQQTQIQKIVHQKGANLQIPKSKR